MQTGDWPTWLLGRAIRRSISNVCLASILFLLFTSPSSFALTLILSDFDDSIVETRQSRDGTFETTHKLFRIDHRTNMLQDAPEGPRTIEVTPQEYERIKEYLGKGNRDHGNISRNVTLQNGVVISPGNYMVVDPDTFERFGSIDGQNPVLDDLKSAIARDPYGKWKGEFWHKMVFMLSDAELANSFGLLTARAHSRGDWLKFFEYLKKEGHIRHVPGNIDLTHSVTLPEYNRFNIKGNVPHLKAAVMRETILRLQRVPLTDRDSRLDLEGKGMAKMHYVVFADDNPKTIELMAELFQEITEGRQIAVKFALFNMGTETNVKASGRPRYSIVEAGGTFRRATAREILGEPTQFSEMEAAAYLADPSAFCAALLTGKGGKK